MLHIDALNLLFASRSICSYMPVNFDLSSRQLSLLNLVPTPRKDEIDIPGRGLLVSG